MIKFKSIEHMCIYYHFEIKTEQDAERARKAWNMYLKGYKGDGLHGCIAELLTATSKSKKTTVSNSGRFDSYIKFRTENGHVIPVPVERKTNGGRIQTFETEYSKAERMVGKFVVYSMDVCNSGTQNLRRYVPAVVIPRELFIEKLIEFNAIKAINHRGVCNGYGIQATSKKLFDWLNDWPVVYDRDAVYCAEDFEGLE